MTRQQQLGKNIRTTRRAKDITLKVLGEKAGASQSYLCDIEKGRKTPNVFLVQDIAKVLKTTVDKLLSK